MHPPHSHLPLFECRGALRSLNPDTGPELYLVRTSVRLPSPSQSNDTLITTKSLNSRSKEPSSEPQLRVSALGVTPVRPCSKSRGTIQVRGPSLPTCVLPSSLSHVDKVRPTDLIVGEPHIDGILPMGSATSNPANPIR